MGELGTGCAKADDHVMSLPVKPTAVKWTTRSPPLDAIFFN
jgi:hypothetical protein